MRLFFILILLPFFGFSQQDKTKNYRRFDEKLLHFGFMMGINTASFRMLPKTNAYDLYQLKSISVNNQPGGQVGIVSSMKLFSPVIRLRFIPTLSFQERAINYAFVHPNPTSDKDLMVEERINSTNLDFPLMLQFRTLRYNNFTSYLLSGMQYSRDLQTKSTSSQNFNDPFIKIKANDLQAQVGGGIEFFAPYFKFAFEVKVSQGFNNSFIQDFTKVSLPIDRLYNKVVWFSLIFEG